MKEFQEKLGRLLGKAEEQGKNLTNEDVLQVFGMNQLSAQQLQSLYEYLRIQGIRIQGVQLKKMDIADRILESQREQENINQESEMPQVQGEGQQVNEEEAPQLAVLDNEDEVCLKEYREYQKMLAPEKEGERVRVLKAYAGGDRSAVERLAQLYLPYILDMARRFYRRGIFLGDLIQEGNMSLLTAPVEDMPEKDADPWMKAQIRRGMEKWLDEQAEQKLRDDSMVERVRKLEAAIRELSDGENQKFSIEELSAYLEMDEEEIRAVLNLTGDGSEDGPNSV